MADTIIELKTDGVSVDEVNSFLEKQWPALINKPRVAELAGGNDLPLAAKPVEGQILVAETIAIAFFSTIGKEAATALWKEYIWPVLKAKFGPDLTESKDAAV